MNDILNRLTVLLSLFVFAVVSSVGFMTGARPMIVLLRATIAFVFFGFLGRIGFRIVLKGILQELAQHKKEQEAEKNKAAEMKNAADISGASERPANTTT